MVAIHCQIKAIDITALWFTALIHEQNIQYHTMAYYMNYEWIEYLPSADADNLLVWGLRLWRAKRAPVWELSWYWLELSALKISIFANANIKFLDDSFWNNNHTYTEERYLYLDFLFVITSRECPHELRYWWFIDSKIEGTTQSRQLDMLSRGYVEYK